MLLTTTFTLIKRRPRLALTAGICGALALRTIVGRFHIMQVIPFLRLDVRQLLLFGTLFLLGALIYELRSHLPLKGWIACVAVVATWLASDTRAGLYILLSTLPYLIAYAACIPVPQRIAAWFTNVDYSYGLYIYAFPLGQTLVMISNNTLSVSTLIIATIAITLPFAVASWYGIEKPALNLKKIFSV
jgi:peptidoglycan/LPS O-acetylase OafA/YrhL